MLEFDNGKKPQSKCYVTHGLMGHIDPRQPPVKRKPFSSILAMPFVHKVELTLPDELYEMIKQELEKHIIPPHYSRVILSLKELLEGDFFNGYIKKGNILMLSEGINEDGNFYFLKDGTLSLILERESYEKCGLVGKPYGPKAIGGIRPKWIIELDLRQPSIHGKKGFGRIVYAFKSVLVEPVTWLFADLDAQDELSNPIQKYHAVNNKCSAQVAVGPKVMMPSLQPPLTYDLDEKDSFKVFSADLYEWFSLVSLQSQRVEAGDRIDPFLSRYDPPPADESSSSDKQLVRITWNGFFSSSWVHGTLTKILMATKPHSWFAFSASGFGNSPDFHFRDLTVLKLPQTSNEYILWEIF